MHAIKVTNGGDTAAVGRTQIVQSPDQFHQHTRIRQAPDYTGPRRR
jgi:hypothetical protein